eukprot:354879-Chlamydomonas_euryale.AAC.5
MLSVGGWLVLVLLPASRSASRTSNVLPKICMPFSASMDASAASTCARQEGCERHGRLVRAYDESM